MKKTKEKPYRLKGEIISFLIVFLFVMGVAVQAQQSTVVIAEVMYDNPLYDNEALAPGKESEFMSLYNYGEDDVNIGGWRVVIAGLAGSRGQTTYTVPANTMLPGMSLAIISSRPARSTFDIGNFYGMVDSATSGNIVLYTSTLAYPDTRSRVRVYNAQDQIEDELVYDGLSAALSGEPLLRATNTVNLKRPMSSTVSIQREKIVIDEGQRIISRNDYYAYGSERLVQLFYYLLEDYSYTAPTSAIKGGVPDDLTLTGTETGDKDYRTKTIVSSQIIANGKTQYWAEEGITLGPGFEVKPGADFVAGVERDSVHLVKLMTYNLHGQHTEYKEHAKVVKKANPDVVAVQEVRGLNKFKILKEKSGYEGKRFCTIVDYGIGLLYKKSSVGDPINVKKQLVATYDKWCEIYRGFIVAEFRDFCFVATHFSLKKDGRKTMANRILENDLVQDCIQQGKPVYIAGDMNEEPANKEQVSSLPILDAAGFKILNNKEKVQSTNIYVDATLHGTFMIDLILEHNTNPYHKTIYRGIPMTENERSQFLEDEISDHLPYFVKVKIK